MTEPDEMTEQQPTNSGGKQGGRFPPGQSGNPLGRPAGSCNKATLLLADLIDGEGEDIVRALVTAAKAGSVIGRPRSAGSTGAAAQGPAGCVRPAGAAH